MTQRLKGLIAAAFTPLRPDGRLDLDRVGALVDHLASDGVRDVLVCGTTGEGPLLTTAERRDVGAAFVRAARGKLSVMVQVGHTSVEEARELARHSQEIGAQGIAALPPWYVKPATLEALAASCAEIASGAPGLPFYYYHIPSMTGVTLPMTGFLPLAPRSIPTFVGIKYSAPTVHEFQILVASDGGRWDIPFGVDEMLLSGLAAGAASAIGSTYNFAAPLYRRLWEAFERGDLARARACQERSARMVEILVKYGNQAAIKAVMKLIGIDCGPSRLPLVTLSADRLSAMERELAAIGFFDWARGGP